MYLILMCSEKYNFVHEKRKKDRNALEILAFHGYFIERVEIIGEFSFPFQNTRPKIWRHGK